MAKELFDGNTSFIGGMDTSRSPSLIAPNQYVMSVNMEIPKAKEGIRTRRGFHCVKLLFNTSKEKEIFENGNVQGIGNYELGNKLIIVLSIDGYIIELIPQSKYIYKVSFSVFRNNKNIKKCFITKVPEGCIVNDGESAAIFLGNKRKRLSPSNNEIGPGLAGVYVQNRFWYIHPEKRIIVGSTIKDSISLQEAIDANIYGFEAPDETEYIVAIGRQKTISRDATGGNLAFATNKGSYSVDVRGARSAWGTIAGTGVGAVTGVVHDFGAVSPFSFESANANIYYRNARYGMMSTKSSQYQFVNSDNFSPVSIESSLFFDNDTTEFLDSCYTKMYGTKLFTTIAPQHKNGFVFWNGLIVISPDIYFSTKDRAEINRVESIYTGIRPYGMTVTENTDGSESMFIASFDKDEINRIYLLDDSADYDTDKDGKIVEIEQKLLTRLYTFGSDFAPKKQMSQFYGISSRRFSRSASIDIFSRNSDTGSFKKSFSNKHSVNCGKCLFSNTEPQEKDVISFAEEASEFYNKQDLVIINGPMTLTKIIRSAMPQPLNVTIDSLQECKDMKPIENIEIDKVYTYKI